MIKMHVIKKIFNR